MTEEPGPRGRRAPQGGERDWALPRAAASSDRSPAWPGPQAGAPPARVCRAALLFKPGLGLNLCLLKTTPNPARWKGVRARRGWFSLSGFSRESPQDSRTHSGAAAASCPLTPARGRLLLDSPLRGRGELWGRIQSSSSFVPVVR